MRSRSLAALAVVATLALAGCGSDNGSESAVDAAPTASSPAAAEASADSSCAYPADAGTAAKQAEAPPPTASRTGKVDVEITTSVGPLRATLDADAAPCTVNSFLSLSEQGYFDDTPCHRLTVAPPSSIAVLQCGDPSGSGMGGPGYSFADELTGDETYPAGTLAMANAGPDTNGSQFFMVYADSTLEPHYTVFGQLDEDSVTLLAALGALGTATGEPDGPPARKVSIESVEVAG
jgi:peptidyl-prolyl cis-trans isomerase B (cyclophilin B)